MPFKRVTGAAKLTPLRDAGADSLLDVAFQGPKSVSVLQKLVSEEDQRVLAAGKLNDIHHIRVNSVPVMAARTGYTGEVGAVGKGEMEGDGGSYAVPINSISGDWL